MTDTDRDVTEWSDEELAEAVRVVDADLGSAEDHVQEAWRVVLDRLRSTEEETEWKVATERLAKLVDTLGEADRVQGDRTLMAGTYPVCGVRWLLRTLRALDRPAPEDPDRGPVRLDRSEVEHVERWAQEATPEQVAAAMREKLRLEKALDRLRSRPSSGDGEAEGDTDLSSVLGEIADERERQDEKWGTVREIIEEHDTLRAPNDWLAILAEEFGELSEACVEERAYRRKGEEGTADYWRVKIRKEAIQTAAVAASFVAWLDRMEQMERAGRALMRRADAAARELQARATRPPSGDGEAVAWMVECDEKCDLGPTIEDEKPEDMTQYECGVCGRGPEQMTVTPLYRAAPPEGEEAGDE